MNQLILLAQDRLPAQSLLDRLLQPECLVFCIPLAAILGVFTFKIVAAIIAHRERMAKIDHGIDPDEPHGRA
jgi:hypothetical protein